MNLKSIRKLRSCATALMTALLLAGCSGGSTKVNENLVPVKSGDRYGFINLEGTYIINPQFDVAVPFTDGRSLVKKGDKWGFIDEKGQYVVMPKYKDALIFSEGVAWTVEEGGAPTLIDTDGNTLLVMKDAETVWPFTDGLAKIKIITADNEEKYGFINKKGEYVITPEYINAKPFSDGLAWVADSKRCTYYIDKSGKIAVNIGNVFLYNFNDGHAIVSIDDKYGLIDKKGKYTINPQFYGLGYDNGHLWMFRQEGSQDIGWCDTKGKFIINPQFKETMSFAGNDFAPVKVGNDWGYIDKKGKLAINPQFELAFPFIDNKVAIVKTGDKIGIIGRDGSYVVNPQFDDVSIHFLRLLCSPVEDFIGSFYLDTDYFDVDKAVEMITAVVQEGGVDGVTFNTPISKILKKYGKDESRLPSWTTFTEVSSGTLGNTLSTELSLEGDFFRSVSDGWWGTTRVLVKEARPTAFHYIVKPIGRGLGKQEELLAALAKKLNLENNDGMSASGTYGKHELTLMLMDEGVDVVLRKEPSGKADTASAEENNISVDLEEDAIYRKYYGNIDGKYEIVMELEFDGDNVSGSYFYRSKNKPISLSGTLDSNDILRLDESVDGKITGQFAGQWSVDEYSGTWMTPDGKKEMPFSLTAN